MNKLPTVNGMHVSGVAPQGAAVVRRNAGPTGLPKNLVAPIRLIGKTAMFAIEVVEIVGFGLALL